MVLKKFTRILVPALLGIIVDFTVKRVLQLSDFFVGKLRLVAGARFPLFPIGDACGVSDLNCCRRCFGSTRRSVGRFSLGKRGRSLSAFGRFWLRRRLERVRFC
jgi:hypothetical protein